MVSLLNFSIYLLFGMLLVVFLMVLYQALKAVLKDADYMFADNLNCSQCGIASFAPLEDKKCKHCLVKA